MCALCGGSNMVAVAALFGMKYYQRPDVTVQLWPPPDQDGLSSHLNCSWKAVGGQPQWAHLPRV